MWPWNKKEIASKAPEKNSMRYFFESIGIQLFSLLVFSLIVGFGTMGKDSMGTNGFFEVTTAAFCMWGMAGSPVLILSSILHAVSMERSSRGRK